MDIQKNNKNINIIYALIAGAAIMYGLFYFFPTELSSVTNISQLEKEVTVTDEGIADAVDKIIDAVVVVETYQGNKGISSGTGFVYKIEGDYAYIMTNNHVIEDGDTVYVNFIDSRRVETTIMGGDATADVAVLRVSKDDVITVAEIGSSEDLRIGDTTFATGAPLDLAYSWSVTRGIISGKDRLVPVSDEVDSWVMSVLQTDAAINSGNSGGPLANSNGEVVGINSLKLAQEGVEGMGFAIPIEDALYFADILEKGEQVERPLLGVSIYDYHEAYFDLELPDEITYGVVVEEITKNSPAAAAGLQKDDLIFEIDGEKIESSAELSYHLYRRKVGDEVEIKYYRDGKLETVIVKL